MALLMFTECYFDTPCASPHTVIALMVLFDVLSCDPGFELSFYRKCARPDGAQEIKSALLCFLCTIVGNLSPKM